MRLDVVKENLDYSENSPTGLVWLKSTRGGRILGGIVQGTPAGTLSPSGYYRTRLHGKCYQNSRLIWSLINGDIPQGLFVDHIDGNPINNLISNLRVVPRGVNTRNCKMLSTNTSGVKGVSEVTNLSGKKAWRACYYFQNKAHTLCFPYNEEGLQAAISWRLENLLRLNNEFNAGYTERHLQSK